MMHKKIMLKRYNREKHYNEKLIFLSTKNP